MVSEASEMKLEMENPDLQLRNSQHEPSHSVLQPKNIGHMELNLDYFSGKSRTERNDVKRIKMAFFPDDNGKKVKFGTPSSSHHVSSRIPLQSLEQLYPNTGLHLAGHQQAHENQIQEKVVAASLVRL